MCLASAASERMPRFHCPLPLEPGLSLDLPSTSARHVQVLRLQPGAVITLFTGEPWQGQWGEFQATVTRMGRSDVEVRVGDFVSVSRQPAREVHLLVGMPANDRMDWLVEKATELGVASISPVMTERSVLRLSGERADKKLAHWRSVAVAASEQCGGNRLPQVHPVVNLATCLAQSRPSLAACVLMSLQADSVPLPKLRGAVSDTAPVFVLTGPEGGLSAAEEAAARAAGFRGVTLGPRILRAETAALAALSAWLLA
jgi:16S rRNA (uracil1498-N3)-methyltransferase